MQTITRRVSTFALLAALGLAGCAEQPTTSSAARLQARLDDANHAVDAWQRDHTIVTQRMQRQLIAPVMTAHQSFTADLRRADDVTLDAIDLDTVADIASGWRKLGTALGFTVAGYEEIGLDAVDEATCTCEEDGLCDDEIEPVPTPEPDPTIPPITEPDPTIPPTTEPTTTDESPFADPVAWKSTCRGAASVANAACVLLCWRKCAFSSAKRKICIAACEVLYAGALTACEDLNEPWSN